MLAFFLLHPFHWLFKLPALLIVGYSAIVWFVHALPQPRPEHQNTPLADSPIAKPLHGLAALVHVYPFLWILLH